VFAAASLTAAFGELGSDFEKAHPGVTVRFNFAGSGTLVTQIGQGASADVFAAADQPTMTKLTAGGYAMGKPEAFAGNHIEIAVPPGNPRHIQSLPDLQNSNVLVDVCAPSVPCGDYANQVFAKANLHITPVSLEQDVKSVLAKVESAEVDAGVVYVTDVQAAGSKVVGVPIPPNQNVLATYPAVAIKGSPNQAGGAAFLAYLLSGPAQQVLGRYGFVKA
jgi:molybdate transport system substrate-binding protein